MIRAFFFVSLLIPGCYAQTPNDPIDPHENPAVQNSPNGKKDPPSKDPTPKVLLPAEPPSAEKVSNLPATAKQPQLVAKPVDPEEIMLGTWSLVVAKSTFNPGPPPRGEIRTYARTPNGITAKTITILQDGSMRTLNFPWQPDGKEHAVSGSDLLDTIRLELVDNLTAEASLRHGDKVLASERRSVAADGKTMTIIVKDMTSDERPIIATAVYEKQR